MKFYKKSLVREVLIENVCDSLKKKNCDGSSLMAPYKDRFIYEDTAQIKAQIFSVVQLSK